MGFNGHKMAAEIKALEWTAVWDKEIPGQKLYNKEYKIIAVTRQ